LTVGAEALREVVFVLLPFTTTERAALRLELISGHIVEVVGATVDIHATGSACYVEELPDDMWPQDFRPMKT